MEYGLFNVTQITVSRPQPSWQVVSIIEAVREKIIVLKTYQK